MCWTGPKQYVGTPLPFGPTDYSICCVEPTTRVGEGRHQAETERCAIPDWCVMSCVGTGAGAVRCGPGTCKCQNAQFIVLHYICICIIAPFIATTTTYSDRPLYDFQELRKSRLLQQHTDFENVMAETIFALSLHASYLVAYTKPTVPLDENISLWTQGSKT
ncbi:hypothetical protein J6590_060617 [Homalodisca vitripennis]|nr:hypothetical protein J6590_060617 [Homalodisca vitripennis]